MAFRKFNKIAFNVWVRPPWVPFTFPGSVTVPERLPGMSQWVPQDVVQRIAQGLEEGEDPQSLAHREATAGLPGSLTKGTIGGLTAGTVGGRLMEGETALDPLKKILSEGLSDPAKTLEHLKSLPRGMRYGPAIGAGLGGLLGLLSWGSGIPEQRRAADQAIRGLLAERVLTRASLQEAVSGNQSKRSVLKGVPMESASEHPAYLARPANTGV